MKRFFLRSFWRVDRVYTPPARIGSPHKFGGCLLWVGLIIVKDWPVSASVVIGYWNKSKNQGYTILLKRGNAGGVNLLLIFAF